MLDMEVPGLAHNISSPLSPCEGMIKDLSLDAIQLCERDGEAASFSLSLSLPLASPVLTACLHLSPSLCGGNKSSAGLLMRWMRAGGRARRVRAWNNRACVHKDVFLHHRRASAPRIFKIPQVKQKRGGDVNIFSSFSLSSPVANQYLFIFLQMFDI